MRFRNGLPETTFRVDQRFSFGRVTSPSLFTLENVGFHGGAGVIFGPKGYFRVMPSIVRHFLRHRTRIDVRVLFQFWYILRVYTYTAKGRGILPRRVILFVWTEGFCKPKLSGGKRTARFFRLDISIGGPRYEES